MDLAYQVIEYTTSHQPSSHDKQQKCDQLDQGTPQARTRDRARGEFELDPRNGAARESLLARLVEAGVRGKKAITSIFRRGAQGQDGTDAVTVLGLLPIDRAAFTYARVASFMCFGGNNYAVLPHERQLPVSAESSSRTTHSSLIT
jgi:hypothetical protein